MTNPLTEGRGISGARHDRRTPRPGQCSGNHRAATGPERPYHQKHEALPRPGQRRYPGPRPQAKSSLRRSWADHTKYASHTEMFNHFGHRRAD